MPTAYGTYQLRLNTEVENLRILKHLEGIAAIFRSARSRRFHC